MTLDHPEQPSATLNSPQQPSTALHALAVRSAELMPGSISFVVHCSPTPCLPSEALCEQIFCHRHWITPEQ